MKNNTKILGLLLAAGAFVSCATAKFVSAPEFTAVLQEELSLNLSQVNLYNGLYVAVGNSGLLLTSPDAKTWKNADSGTDSDLNWIIHDGERYIVVGKEGTALVSRDAQTWTKSPTGVNALLKTAETNGQVTVAGGGEGIILRTTDYAQWEIIRLDHAETITSIIWNGSIFTAVTNSNASYVSGDGRRWEKFIVSPDAPVTFKNLTWHSGGYYIAVGYNGVVGTSPDGKNWKVFYPFPERLDLNDMDYDSATNRTSVCGDGGLLYITYDGLDREGGARWERIATGVEDNLAAVAINDGLVVLVGESETIVRVTPEGAAEIERRVENLKFKAISYVGGEFIAVGVPGISRISEDGKTWREVDTANTVSLLDVDYWNGTYIAVGNKGEIVISEDAETWRRLEPITMEELNALAVGGGVVVVVGDNGAVLRSSDCVTWSKVPMDNPYQFKTIIRASDRFVAAANGGWFLESPDGLTWTAYQSDIIAEPQDISFNGEVYAAVYSDGSIARSVDLRVWEKSVSGTTKKLEYLSWSGSYFVAVGKESTILYSRDGVKWTQAKNDFPGRELSAVDCDDNGRFVVLGLGIIAVGE
jgi:hypothetical protein